MSFYLLCRKKEKKEKKEKERKEKRRKEGKERKRKGKEERKSKLSFQMSDPALQKAVEEKLQSLVDCLRELETIVGDFQPESKQLVERKVYVFLFLFLSFFSTPQFVDFMAWCSI